MKRLSLSADLCIHSYWLSWLRQASHRKMIRSLTLRLRLWRFKILTCPLLNTQICRTGYLDWDCYRKSHLDNNFVQTFLIQQKKDAHLAWKFLITRKFSSKYRKFSEPSSHKWIPIEMGKMDYYFSLAHQQVRWNIFESSWA